MQPLLAVFLGGGIGASMRYLLSQLFTASFVLYPVATLTCNLLGCFAAGFVGPQLVKLSHWAPFLLIGVLGGFTTFSSFALELFNLSADNHLSTAAWFFVLNSFGALFCCYLGVKLSAAIW